jgi:NAD-dependent dihydropyrimidine dehydrogenase PreA subunit
MIAIAIDDKACVGCSLCAEVCPTDVFTFDEAKGLPEVTQAAECFGCLSCSEICPPGCITHDGVVLAESHHHGPYALHLGMRLGTDSAAAHINAPDDPVRRAKALEDLGVRLRSVAEVFKRTLGGSLPAVGTMAGRTLARHLPRYRPPQSLAEAVELTVERLAPAWVMDTALDGDSLTVTVHDCFVREVCQREKLELGGELCVLFYNYLAGYLGAIGKTRLRLSHAERGWEKCTYQVKVYGEV